MIKHIRIRFGQALMMAGIAILPEPLRTGVRRMISIGHGIVEPLPWLQRRLLDKDGARGVVINVDVRCEEWEP